MNIVISSSYRLLTNTNRTTARRFWLRQSVTKWVETLHPNRGFFTFYLLQKEENIAFPPPSPPCNVVPMFELPIENNKHPNFERRGQGRGVDSFVLRSYPIWVQCLNNLGAHCSLFSSFVLINLKASLLRCNQNFIKLEQLSRIDYFKAGLNSSHFKMLI